MKDPAHCHSAWIEMFCKNKIRSKIAKCKMERNSSLISIFSVKIILNIGIVRLIIKLIYQPRAVIAWWFGLCRGLHCRIARITSHCRDPYPLTRILGFNHRGSFKRCRWILVCAFLKELRQDLIGHFVTVSGLVVRPLRKFLFLGGMCSENNSISHPFLVESYGGGYPQGHKRILVFRCLNEIKQCVLENKSKAVAVASLTVWEKCMIAC